MAPILSRGRLLDTYGIAGFGWGIAWSDGDALHRYRSVDGIRRDLTAPQTLQQIAVQKGYVHSRRPSLMSTIGHLNVQPYLSPTGDWAFAHNGYLARHHDFCSRFFSQLLGSSDSEVGFWYWMERVQTNASVMQSFIETHQALKGNANFMALSRRGELGGYAGNKLHMSEPAGSAEPS
jgi:predicted glutamine amidotransferase